MLNPYISDILAAIVGYGCTQIQLAPQMAPHSKIVKIRDGKIAKLECNDGYRMKDPDDGIFVCNQNVWIGFPGKCLRKLVLSSL